MTIAASLPQTGDRDGGDGRVRRRILLIRAYGLEYSVSGTSAALEQHGFEVEQCLGGIAIFEGCARFCPDIVMVDGRTDFAAGLQYCRTLRAIPETNLLPLVVLAPVDDEQMRVEALEAGADEFIAKPIASREALLRLRALARRSDAAHGSRRLCYERIILDLDAHRVRRGGVPVTLTAMQFRLLRFLIERPTTVFSRRELLKAVWGNVALDEGAVTACIARLRRALNEAGGPNLVRSIPGSGYSLDAEISRDAKV